MRSITTLYKEMTPSQLAIVSVNASLNGDDETPKAILGYVPKRTYSCTDAGYTDLAQFVTAWLLAIGSDYWKARAKHIGSLFYLTRIAAKSGKEISGTSRSRGLGQRLTLTRILRNAGKHHV